MKGMVPGSHRRGDYAGCRESSRGGYGALAGLINDGLSGPVREGPQKCTEI